MIKQKKNHLNFILNLKIFDVFDVSLLWSLWWKNESINHDISNDYTYFQILTIRVINKVQICPPDIQCEVPRIYRISVVEQIKP